MRAETIIEDSFMIQIKKNCIQVIYHRPLDFLGIDDTNITKTQKEVLEDDEKDMYATEYKRSFAVLSANEPEKQILEERSKRSANKPKRKSQRPQRSKSRERKEVPIDINDDLEQVKANINKKISDEKKAELTKKEMPTHKVKDYSKTTKKDTHKKVVEKQSKTVVNENKPTETKKHVTWSNNVVKETTQPPKVSGTIRKSEVSIHHKTMPNAK